MKGEDNMGYYTHYSLEVRGIKTIGEHATLCNRIEKFDCFQKDAYSLYDPEAYFESNYETKWYEHENDMIHLSQFFPDMTFCLEGIGEDYDDRWRKYFHNGIMDYCPACISYLKPTKIYWND